MGTNSPGQRNGKGKEWEEKAAEHVILGQRESVLCTHTQLLRSTGPPHWKWPSLRQVVIKAL